MKKFSYGIARDINSEPLVCYISLKRARSFIKENKQHGSNLIIVKMKDRASGRR